MRGSRHGGGRSFRGGQARVYGCSPGCLIVSIVLSLVLTLLVNSCIQLT